MKKSNAALYLFSVFLGSFILLLLFCFILFLQKRIYSDDLIEMLVSIVKLYSIHVAIFVSAKFFNQIDNNVNVVNRRVFIIAMLLCCLWNITLVVGAFILSFVVSVNDFNEILAYLNTIGSNSAFIITGVLAYFFIEKKE